MKKSSKLFRKVHGFLSCITSAIAVWRLSTSAALLLLLIVGRLIALISTAALSVLLLIAFCTACTTPLSLPLCIAAGSLTRSAGWRLRISPVAVVAAAAVVAISTARRRVVVWALLLWTTLLVGVVVVWWLCRLLLISLRSPWVAAVVAALITVLWCRSPRSTATTAASTAVVAVETLLIAMTLLLLISATSAIVLLISLVLITCKNEKKRVAMNWKNVKSLLFITQGLKRLPLQSRHSYIESKLSRRWYLKIHIGAQLSLQLKWTAVKAGAWEWEGKSSTLMAKVLS